MDDVEAAVVRMKHRIPDVKGVWEGYLLVIVELWFWW